MAATSKKRPKQAKGSGKAPRSEEALKTGGQHALGLRSGESPGGEEPTERKSLDKQVKAQYTLGERQSRIACKYILTTSKPRRIM